MVTKQCPKCQQYVPVACKACPCGHVFFVARRPVNIHKVGRNTEEGEIKRRRTERTKRERPDYFNSLQFTNELKKTKNVQKSRKKTDSSNNNEKEAEGSNSEGSEAANGRNRRSLNTKSKKRGRPKKNFSNEKVEKDKEEDVDMFANLSKEKELQFSIILSEINRKLQLQQFKLD